VRFLTITRQSTLDQSIARTHTQAAVAREKPLHAHFLNEQAVLQRQVLLLLLLLLGIRIRVCVRERAHFRFSSLLLLQKSRTEQRSC
jgi:hypothetical protein